MSISDCVSIQENKHSHLLSYFLLAMLALIDLPWYRLKYHLVCLDIHGSQRVNPIDLDDPVSLIEYIASKLRGMGFLQVSA